LRRSLAPMRAEDLRVVDEPVDHGGGDDVVAEDVAPCREGLVADRPADRVAMQPRPTPDLALREALDEVQPTDLGPLLHPDHLGPPELVLRTRAQAPKTTGRVLRWPTFNRRRWPSFHPAPTPFGPARQRCHRRETRDQRVRRFALSRLATCLARTDSSGIASARQRSASAGSTKRDGVRGSEVPRSWTREPCRPDLEGLRTVASGSPPCATIHAMTASKSAPSARIAARSMTIPPEGWGRASRVSRERIVSSSTV
jgi:hypothetical protein